MEAFIVIITFLAVVVLVGRWRARQATLSTNAFPQQQLEWSGPRGLFDDPAAQAALIAAEAETAARQHADALQAELRARAEAGEHAVLLEADAVGGAALFRELLDVLAARSADLPALLQLLAQNSQWRGSPRLAQALLVRWQSAPEKFALGELLHWAALSDDAAVFQQTVEATLQAWQQGRLSWASPQNLRALLESEYWLLSPAARQTGAGFVLKRRLVEVRRELAAATQTATS